MGRETNEELENLSDAKKIKTPRRYAFKYRFTPKNNRKSSRDLLVGVVYDYICILVNQINKYSSFIYVFLEQIFIVSLLCARHICQMSMIQC